MTELIEREVGAQRPGEEFIVTRTIGAFAVFLCIVVPASSLTAQVKPAAGQEYVPAPVPVSLKVQLVLGRYQGEKRISSMPYTLQLTANERETTNLRMTTDVPVPNQGGGYNYRPVGTSIDCRAGTATDGVYRLHVTLNDTSIRLPEPKDAGSTSASGATVPSFRSFTANFTIVLRDGQTAQYTSATDPASGEVLKVDASLSVLK